MLNLIDFLLICEWAFQMAQIFGEDKQNLKMKDYFDIRHQNLWNFKISTLFSSIQVKVMTFSPSWRLLFVVVT